MASRAIHAAVLLSGGTASAGAPLGGDPAPLPLQAPSANATVRNSEKRAGMQGTSVDTYERLYAFGRRHRLSYEKHRGRRIANALCQPRVRHERFRGDRFDHGNL